MQFAIKVFMFIVFEDFKIDFAKQRNNSTKPPKHKAGFFGHDPRFFIANRASHHHGQQPWSVA